MQAQIQNFLSERGGGGGGGGKPNAEKTTMIFFMFVFRVFFVQNFPGMRGGVQLFTGGGGVQVLISIKFDRTCDLPGMGVRTPDPQPSGSAHS